MNPWDTLKPEQVGKVWEHPADTETDADIEWLKQQVADTLDVTVIKDGIATVHKNVPRYFPDPELSPEDEAIITDRDLGDETENGG